MMGSRGSEEEEIYLHELQVKFNSIQLCKCNKPESVIQKWDFFYFK